MCTTGLLFALTCQSYSKGKHKGAVLSLLLPLLVGSVFLLSGPPHYTADSYHVPSRSGRTLLVHWGDSIINLEDKRYLAGYIIGVFSAGLYVCSRVPQIVKNVRICLFLCLSSYLSLSLSLSHTHTLFFHISAFPLSSCVVPLKVCLSTCSSWLSSVTSPTVLASFSTQWMVSSSFRSCLGWLVASGHYAST